MRRIKNLLKKGTSLMLTFAMLMGLCSTGFAVARDNNGDDVISYVSLGDSMTNGYGLDGYEPDPDNNMFGFEVDVEDAYPHLVAEMLGAKLTQLATSGIRAEDLYYLLNYGTEYAVEWDEYGALYIPDKFDAKYTPAQAAEIFQDAVKNADVISIGMGSNNFATLLDMRLMNWMGRILGADSMFAGAGYGGEFDFNELVSELTAEQKAQIAEIYASVEETIKEAAAKNGIPMDIVMAEDGATVSDFAMDIANAISYTTAGFVLGYKGIIDTIVRENSDAEIIIVGLTNWFRGMDFAMPVGDEMLVFPVGDVMEIVCDFAGSYMAALPAVYEVAAQINGTEMQPIYYADTNAAGVPDIELLIEEIVANSAGCVDFDALNALEGDAQFALALEMATQIDEIGVDAILPIGTTEARLESTLEGFAYDEDGNFMPFVLDGLKISMIASLHADAMNVAHFGVLSSYEDLGKIVEAAIGRAVSAEGFDMQPEYIAAAMMCVPELVTVSNLLFNFVVGDGVILHPSADGHEVIANVVVDAYNNNYTATDKTMDDVMEGLDALAALIAEYYDDAYKFGYDYAANNGYIIAAEKALDYAADELTAIEALVMEGEMSDAFRAELTNEFATARETIALVKALLGNAELNETALADALALLANLQENLNNILALLNIAYEDIAPVVMAEIKARIEALNAYVENEVIPAVEKAVREAYEYAVNYLRNLVAQLEAAVAEMKAALIAHVNEKVAAAIAQLEAAIAELKAAIANQINMTVEQFQTAVETAVKELVTSIVELIHTAQQQGENWVKAVVDHFVSQVMAIYNNATHGEFAKSADSYYVAIGDGSVSGYAELLAEALEIEYEVIDIEALLANAAAVAGADLITVGYSNNTMIDYMFAQLKAYLEGKPVDEYDWSKYVTAEGVPYVEQALADVRAELVAMGLEPIEFLDEEIDVVEVTMVAIEAYAYAYVGYMVTYPQLIMAIREINSDALIVSVGMNNALADLAFDLEGTEFAIGEYVQYVVDVANAEAMAFALLTGETVFVDAPAVDTVADISSMTLGAFLKKIVISSNPTEDFNASAEGNAYIAEQILNALTVKHVHTEVVLAAVEATCEKTGLTEGLMCSDCGEILIAQEVIPALGHEDNNWDMMCDNCGGDMKDFCEHDWQLDMWNSRAACHPEGGVELYFCWNCGAEKSVELEKAPHPGCYYVEQEDPTCLDGGVAAHYRCEACEAYVNQDLTDAGYPEELEALGHKYVDGICVNLDEWGETCGHTALYVEVETETEIAHYGDLVEYTVTLSGANTLSNGITGGSFKLNIATYLTLVEIAAGEDSGMEVTWDSKNKIVTLTGNCTGEDVVLFTFACVVTTNYSSSIATSTTTSANVTMPWGNRILNSGDYVLDGGGFEVNENAKITLHKIDLSTLVFDENGHTFKCANTACTVTHSEHAYACKVEAEPTCTTTGLERYTCYFAACGHSYVKEIPTVDHVDADKNGYCDKCGNECDEIAATISQLAELLAKYGVDLYDVIDKLEAAVAELREELGVGTDEELEAAIAELEAAIAELEAAIENGAVESAIAELEAAVMDLITTAMGKGEELVNAVEQFVYEIKSICNNAVHGEYVKGKDSYYVAIGDGSITGNSYVDILAAELAVKFNNIGVEGLNVADIAAILAANAEEIAGADLITVGFSNNTMIEYMVAQMKTVLVGGTAVDHDWSERLDKDAAAYVEQALAEIRAELNAMGLEPIELDDETSIDVVELLMTAVESYAYSYTGYLFGYPEMINAIRAINSDALIVSVGMNNALANVAFDLNGNEFAIGKYVQYLVDAANIEALAFALLNEGVVFVDAPAVETIAEDTNSAIFNTLGDFLTNIVLSGDATEEFYASADGHAYIAEQILNALTVTEEEPGAINVVMGDLTGDGIVDVADAVMMLKAIAAKTTGEFSVEMFTAADVTRDGLVDVADAVKLLKAIASKTTGEL